MNGVGGGEVIVGYDEIRLAARKYLQYVCAIILEGKKIGEGQNCECIFYLGRSFMSIFDFVTFLS